MAERPKPPAFSCKACGEIHPRGCTGHRSSAPKLDNGHAPPCSRSPIRGGKVCPSHGGRAPQARRKAAERVEVAIVVREAARLGVRVEIDPGEALLAALYAAYGHQLYLEARVAALGDSEVYSSLFHAAVKDGEPTPIGEAKRHVLVQMLEDAIKRTAGIAALALRAGVEERRVRLAENDVRDLGADVLGALTDAEAPAELVQRIKVALAARLRRRMLPPAA